MYYTSHDKNVHLTDQFFHFFIVERYGVLDIKYTNYEPKELWMHVYDTFCRGRPSDNEQLGGGLNSMSAF